MGIWGAGAVEDYRVTTLPSGEPIVHTMELTAETPDLVTSVRPFYENISAYELWQVQKQRRDLREEYLEYWNSSVALTDTGRPIDAIISPCAPSTAPPHGMNRCVFAMSIFFLRSI